MPFVVWSKHIYASSVSLLLKHEFPILYDILWHFQTSSCVIEARIQHISYFAHITVIIHEVKEKLSYFSAQSPDYVYNESTVKWFYLIPYFFTLISNLYDSQFVKSFETSLYCNNFGNLWTFFIEINAHSFLINTSRIESFQYLVTRCPGFRTSIVNYSDKVRIS